MIDHRSEANSLSWRLEFGEPSRNLQRYALVLILSSTTSRWICTDKAARVMVTQVDELLEENEQLVVDIDKHQQDKSKSKAKQKESLVQAEKKIQQLNRNTHQIVALYKKLAQAAAKAGKKETG